MATATDKKERVTSRIGDLPVEIPAGVEVKISGDLLSVKGSKGSLEQKIPDGVEVVIDGNIASVKNKAGIKAVKRFQGLIRALLANMVNGVSVGFVKELTIEGIGYRAAVKGKVLEVNVGYSNPVEYPITDDIEISVDGNVNVKVEGIDKHRVGHVAAEIRKIRPPEPYKGKGIRYKNEVIRKKVGKSGA